MNRLMAGRTSLIIAHRLSTVRTADRILLLHRGRLIEEGSHAELLARQGAYARLYELMYGTEGVVVGQDRRGRPIASQPCITTR